MNQLDYFILYLKCLICKFLTEITFYKLFQQPYIGLQQIFNIDRRIYLLEYLQNRAFDRQTLIRNFLKPKLTQGLTHQSPILFIIINATVKSEQPILSETWIQYPYVISEENSCLILLDDLSHSGLQCFIELLRLLSVYLTENLSISPILSIPAQDGRLIFRPRCIFRRTGNLHNGVLYFRRHSNIPRLIRYIPLVIEHMKSRSFCKLKGRVCIGVLIGLVGVFGVGVLVKFFDYIWRLQMLFILRIQTILHWTPFSATRISKTLVPSRNYPPLSPRSCSSPLLASLAYHCCSMPAFSPFSVSMITIGFIRCTLILSKPLRMICRRMIGISRWRLQGLFVCFLKGLT